jgi:peroxiredoxin
LRGKDGAGEPFIPGVTTMRDHRDARSSNPGDRGRRHPGLRWWTARLLAATALWAGLGVTAAARADDSGPAEGVTFAGRVVELESGRPLAGASVIMERSIRGAEPGIDPPWAASSTTTTDAEGRFRLSFPPEQAAERGFCFALRIKRPGFVSRKCNKVALVDLIRGRDRGEEPFFATIKLERGVEYTARVMIPGDKPAAAIPFTFANWTWGKNQSDHFQDDTEGQTDDQGRIRVTTLKSQAAALYVGPPKAPRARFPYAPYQHFWGTNEPSKNPNAWVPTDLGRIVLARGIRLSGRVVDTDGRPIAGQAVTAYPVRGQDQHPALTEADGSFSLGPLRPANYMVYGGGQDLSAGLDPDAPRLRRPIRVIRPARVYLQEGVLPEPLVLREMPTVRLEVRFVDSRGNPARGGPAKVWGLIPNARGQADPFGAISRVGGGLASEINDPEPRDTADRTDWSVEDWPDAAGRIIFPVPRGLQAATLFALPFDETVAYKTRMQPGGPLRFWGGGRLGTINEDRQVTIVAYRSPMVVVTVKAEHGFVPDGVRVDAGFTSNGGGYGESFVRTADGRFRSQSFMPDHEYRIYAGDQGGNYVPRKIFRLKLAEGGSADLTMMLRKRPKPPEPGRPAPAFSVRTTDGRMLSLAALRGKTVLLHFWSLRDGPKDAPSLKAVRDRFAKDDRFAMVGLCLGEDAGAAARVVQARGLSWPQAILLDDAADPIPIDYGAADPYKAFLIGPDGRLIARDLDGPALEKAVADALGPK